MRFSSPSTVIITDAIEDACHSGLTVFDFLPSGGHKSVDDFKRGFGTEALPITTLRYAGRSYQFANGFVHAIGRRDKRRTAA
jgi:hypothetical protein